ncbi:serine hydrolase domain-containing protein [Streptomyces sp. NPDC001719]
MVAATCTSGATAATPAARASAAPAGHGYHPADLRRDVDAVRAAGHGTLNLVPRLDTPDGALRARSGRMPGTDAALPLDLEYRIASTSRAFTAVVILQLVTEGRLSLDDTVEHWLPGVVSGHGNAGSKVTVLDLLRHTSGLFDYAREPGWHEKYFPSGRSGDPAIRFDATPPRQRLPYAFAHPPLYVPRHDTDRPPSNYSNTNYVLAGVIAEKAEGTGTTWRDLVEHRIIAPLGLRHTSIIGHPTRPGPPEVHFSHSGNGPELLRDFLEKPPPPHCGTPERSPGKAEPTRSRRAPGDQHDGVRDRVAMSSQKRWSSLHVMRCQGARLRRSQDRGPRMPTRR